MSTFTTDSPIGQWIGYQAIYGAGIGFGMQQPLIAIQTVLPENQVAEGTVCITPIDSSKQELTWFIFTGDDHIHPDIRRSHLPCRRAKRPQQQADCERPRLEYPHRRRVTAFARGHVYGVVGSRGILA
jgi:hypothetical protein